MSLNDPVADALNKINNAEDAAKEECKINHSKFLEKIVSLLKKEGYLKNYKVLNRRPANKIIINLDGSINKCKAIKPRHAVKKDDFEKFEKSFLISRDVGLLIVSTTKGVLTHKHAKQKGIGGRLIAYIY